MSETNDDPRFLFPKRQSDAEWVNVRCPQCSWWNFGVSSKAPEGIRLKCHCPRCKHDFIYTTRKPMLRITE